MFNCMYITNKIEVAKIAEKYGVDRIWIDLECNGKAERQRGMNSVISGHTLQDVHAMRYALENAHLLVRVNPWQEESKKEIDEVIRAGADIVMLPMWKTKEDVERFYDVVDGRAHTILLLETKEAVEQALDDVLKLDVEEIHVGLRDLSLSYGIEFLFDIFRENIIEKLSKKIRAKGIKFGIGGIGRFGVGYLPGPEILLIEYIRLGASSVILSRSFCDSETYKNIESIEANFRYGMKEFRKWETLAYRMPREIMEYNHREMLFELENSDTI